MNASPLCPGMRVEILASAGELLFEAKVTRVVRDELVEIEKVSAAQAALPKETAEIRVRGYNTQLNRGLWLEGKIAPFARNREDYWLLEGLKVTGQDSGRTYSRQYDIDAVGFVQAAGDPEAAAVPCRITNISTGGAAVRTEARFAAGDELLLSAKVRKGKEQPPLLCRVRRITERDDGQFDYGCEFVEDGPEAEDRIIKTVLEIQIMGLPNAVELPPQLFHT